MSGMKAANYHLLYAVFLPAIMPALLSKKYVNQKKDKAASDDDISSSESSDQSDESDDAERSSSDDETNSSRAATDENMSDDTSDSYQPRKTSAASTRSTEPKRKPKPKAKPKAKSKSKGKKTTIIDNPQAKEHRQLFCLLGQVVVLSSERVLTELSLVRLQGLLGQYIALFKLVFPTRKMPPNMHFVLAHLTQCYREYGPPHGFWLFVFERVNGMMVALT
jgi:DNA mismatch repair ATPase MutL